MSPTPGLSKTRLSYWRQCPKRLWLAAYRKDLIREDPAAEARFAIGHAVGELARQLEPGGLLIGHDNDPGAALTETRALMAGGVTQPLFEPTFSHDGLLVRIDLLLPEGDGFHLVEVKSTGSVKDPHLPDAAIQAWVASRDGVELCDVSIAHLDTSFVYPGNGDYRGILQRESVLERIVDLQSEVPEWIRGARETLSGEMPEIAPGEQCHSPYDCPFQHHCWPLQPDYPVTLLPGIKGKKLATTLAMDGFTDLREVPAGRVTDPVLKRIHEVTLSGQSYLDPKLSDTLRTLPFPRYYLDFETVSFAIPVWAGTRPFQALPFQWSCHIEPSSGHLGHTEYLDTLGANPIRSFAESLIVALGTAGPIVVYSAYEKRILGELAQAFPDLAPQLDALAQRLYDLLPLVRNGYYHPAMKGSWSIKAVLPAVAPELDYAALSEVNDGTSAQQAYIEMIAPNTAVERASELEKSLRAYCQLDTFAMVRVVQSLQ